MWHSQHVLSALASKNRPFSFAAPYGNTGEFIAVVITLMEQVSAVRGQSATSQTTWRGAPALTKKGEVREGWKKGEKNGPVSTSMGALLVTVTWQRLLFCLIILDYIFLWERQMPHWLFIWEAILSLHNYPVFKGPARMGWTAGSCDANNPKKSLRLRWILDFSTTEAKVHERVWKKSLISRERHQTHNLNLIMN